MDSEAFYDHFEQWANERAALREEMLQKKRKQRKRAARLIAPIVLVLAFMALWTWVMVA